MRELSRRKATPIVGFSRGPFELPTTNPASGDRCALRHRFQSSIEATALFPNISLLNGHTLRAHVEFQRASFESPENLRAAIFRVRGCSSAAAALPPNRASDPQMTLDR